MKLSIGKKLIIKTYILVLLIFLVFRMGLFFMGIEKLEDESFSFFNILKAFVMGLRFDIVISGYILFIPAFAIFIQDVFSLKTRWIYKITFFWIFVLFTIAFLISAVDIPYFNQFFSRFSIGAFEWMDSPAFIFKMIYQEPIYIFAFLGWVFLIYIFYRFLRKIFLINIEQIKGKIIVKTLTSLLVLAIMFLGVRGRIEKKSPIRIGTAYFCNDPFLNQLGLNPTFTLIRTAIDHSKEKNKPIQLMDNDEAIKNVQHYLGIKNPINDPIARQIIPDSILSKRPNVVVIMMESMSAFKMERHGNPNHLTPFLDSLSNQSYYFENIYTAGEHTFNGIFSTLFAFPSLFRQHPLKIIKQYPSGFGATLKSLGYSTTFFSTHDTQFDNMEGFLHANNFEHIVGQSDYPSKEVKTTLGVPDDYMFRYAIPYIDDLTKQKQPFFVSFMTSSDHIPFYIPEYFTSTAKKKNQQIVQYADWSLQQFIQNASRKEWFDNTIFVFIADHGAALDVHYEIPLNYHHSPLIIYAPKFLSPKLFSKIGSQMDVFPTIMGILRQKYMNQTLGIDLVSEERPYTIINGDDKVGVLDLEFLLILKKDESRKLYKYHTNSNTDYSSEFPTKVNEMEQYLKSNLQVFQYEILHY